MLGLAQGFRALPPLNDFISEVERIQGAEMDWRMTAFWRHSSFVPAWDAFTRREDKLLDEEALPEALARDKCAPFLNPATGEALTCAGSRLHAVLLRCPHGFHNLSSFVAPLSSMHLA